MAKRKREHSSLAEMLSEFISKNQLQSGLDKVAVRDAWFKVMGVAISKYTTQVLLERDVLYVQLSSSVLREELSYGREKIIKLINAEIGKELITKLVLR